MHDMIKFTLNITRKRQKTKDRSQGGHDRKGSVCKNGNNE